MPRTVLVTGAGGFIGRPLVTSLLAAGYAIAIVARAPRHGPNHPRLTIVPWDLLDAQPSPEPLRGIEVAVHLAARIPGSDWTPADRFAANVTMTTNLLRRLVDVRHVIFGSTIDVYGRPQTLPIREDAPTEPLTAYAVSKLRSEDRLRTLSRERGFALMVLRLSQVYGPGDRSAKLIPQVIEALLRGRPPVIYGDGSDLRDYAYVDDVVRAVALALPRWNSGVFNVSSGHPTPIARVVEILSALAGGTIQPVHVDRRGEKFDLALDISRIRGALGFTPRTTLEEGLRRQYEWARAVRC